MAMFREYLSRLKNPEVPPRHVRVFIGSGYSETALSEGEHSEMESYYSKYR